MALCSAAHTFRREAGWSNYLLALVTTVQVRKGNELLMSYGLLASKQFQACVCPDDL
jgi:hypothetical protein